MPRHLYLVLALKIGKSKVKVQQEVGCVLVFGVQRTSQIEGFRKRRG